jgi:hypothetical protein
MCALEWLAAVCAIVLYVRISFLFLLSSSDCLPLSLYLFLHVKTSYRLDNAKRDKLHGKVSLDEKVDTSELADKVRILKVLPRRSKRFQYSHLRAL